MVRRASRLQPDVDRHRRGGRERPHEVLDQARVERADHLRRDLDLVDDERAPREIQRDLDRGLVERHGDRREPPDALLVAQRLRQRLPHRDAHVLHGVVPVDLEVALRRHLQVPPGVRAQLLQHVIEERQSGVGGRGPRAVQRQLHADVGLLRGAHHRGGACDIGHAASTSSSADRNRSTSSVVPAVTRSAFGNDGREVADEHAAVHQTLPHLGGGLRRHEQDEVRVGGIDRDVGHRAERGEDPVALVADRVQDRHGFLRVAERGDAGGLRDGRQVVREADALQVTDHVGRPERVADPRAGQRERLRHRARDDDVRVVGDERQARRAAELDVRLVDDDEGVGPPGEGRHRVHRLRVPGRVVRRADEHDVGSRADGRRDAVLREREAVAQRQRHDVGLRQPRDPRVQEVRGFEHRGAPAGAAVRLEELRQDLVRAVRRPRAVERVTDGRGQLLAEPGHLSVGVPVERERRDLVRELVGEPLRERQRALVRVQPRGHRQLRRDVRRHVAHARSRGRGHDAPSVIRASMAAACPTSPSLRAIVDVSGARRVADAAVISTTERTVT